MINETKKNIEAYKALLPGLKERVAAVALMLVMSVVMMTSATYAWLTISRAPEVQGMNTTITGNGNLEIALVPADGSVPGDATGGISDLLMTNVTWGNLVNLSDSRYGLDEIALRPALLSGYNRNQTPLYGASYGEDGRVESTSDKYGFASYTMADDGSYYFAAGSAARYGVRAISSVKYSNISGNATVNAMIQRASAAYREAQLHYSQLINNELLISSEGVYPEVRSMDALSMFLQVYVQDRAGYYADKLNGVTHVDGDYSGVIAYVYRLCLEFQEILEEEGKALLYLANLQAYKANQQGGTETFKTIDELLAAYTNNKLSGYGVKLESLATYKQDYNDIKATINGLKSYAEQCDPDDPEKYNNRPTVPFSSIQTHVNRLVDIPSTAVAEYGSSKYLKMSEISSSTLTSFLSVVTTATNANKPLDVLISKGIIARTEQRLPEVFSDTMDGADTRVTMYLTVKVSLVGINWNNKAVYATIRTTANDPFISNTDRSYSESLENTGNSGEAVAKDTYGMALDLWVRTNVSNVILTLEGNLVTEEVTATTVDKNGQTTTLYTLTATTTSDPITVYGVTDAAGVTTYYSADGTQLGDSTTMTTVAGYTFTKTDGNITLEDGTVATAYSMKQTVSDSQNAYKITVDGEEYWYNADTHAEIGKASELTNVSATEQKVEMVTGYDGVNRVWEDYLSLIEAGLMAEHNTTQGNGSCYVFYADPSEQSRILHLLEAFTVVFTDQNGTTLGTAKLDTEHYYSINGKTTVPLIMISGETYEDADGNEQIGITALEKNEATWITSIIYLDGQRLTNADVLSVGEIEGSLNIQFGSNISLTNQDDTDLRNEQREIEAMATYNGTNSSSTQQPISFEYDGNAKQVTVTLTVNGKQPRTIKGFFIRSISATQGTRCETVDFTDNHNNTWTAVFDLSKPGTYLLRNLIVDGSDYSLYDGTKSEEDFDNFPTVIISGQGIESIHCDLPSGITMTADRTLTANVTASIAAAGDLMPKQVRALFRSADNREFTALLSYQGTSNTGGSLWSGSVTFTESGTYTLQYLVMDGEHRPLDAAFQSTHIIYLGLTAQVWSNGVPVQDEQGNTVYSNTFEFKGATDIDMQVKIYDGSGNELKSLEDVYLYYHNEGSTLDQDGMYGEVTWNGSTGFYEGTLQLKSGGTFIFDRVVTNKSGANPSTISRATLAPTFTAYVTDPPAYEGHTTTDYQFVPDGKATMTVKLTNAQTATIWALMRNEKSGKVYMVSCANRQVEDADDNLYRFTFYVPSDETQDGNWQIISLYLQGCANQDEEWVGLTENPLGDAAWITLTDNGDGTWTYGTDKTLDPADYVTFDLSGNNVEAYVVQTVYINGVTSDELTFNNVVFGVDDTNKNGVRDNNETITGTFMQAHSTSAMTLTITDWNGEAITGVTGVTWATTHGTDSQAKGGYTGAYENPPAVNLSGSGTTYTLAAQTLRMAGSYTSQFAIKVGDDTKTLAGPKFEVWSVTPTVIISDITLDGSGAYAVDLFETGHICDSYKNTGSTCSPQYDFTINNKHVFAASNTQYLTRIENDHTAWLYFKCSHSKTTSTWTDKNFVTWSPHDYSYNNGAGVPAATLKLTNMGFASNAELVFTKTGGGDVIMVTQYTAKSGGYWGDYDTYGTDRFTWSADGTCQRFIGVMNNAAGENDSGTKTVAGTITASELILTDANGNKYYFTIPTITIHNPY